MSSIVIQEPAVALDNKIDRVVHDAETRQEQSIISKKRVDLILDLRFQIDQIPGVFAIYAIIILLRNLQDLVHHHHISIFQDLLGNALRNWTIFISSSLVDILALVESELLFAEIVI